jgi:hypothetical protein
LADVLSTGNIRGRFSKNLKRVRHLLDVFVTLHPGTGRPSELHADVVRSAVVFLHASLEDLLRSCEEVRLDQAPVTAFEGMRWMLPSGEEGKTQLTLSQLAQYRGVKVEDVLRRAFERHHERSNYNNEKDVVGALERMGIAGEPFKVHYSRLNAMMARRHLIAHRADANPRFPNLTNPIGVKLAESWRATIESFGEQLLSSL